jgi:predicted XRE-type DNA-binding protein
MDQSTETIERDAISVTRGSGNIFVDLGFDEAEAEELQVKALLTHQIYERIQALGLTQKEAVERLGISQPDVSKLMHSRYTGFSTDRLLALLNALDLDIEIVLRPCTEHVAAHRVRVRVQRPRGPRLARAADRRPVRGRRSSGRKRTGALAERATP